MKILIAPDSFKDCLSALEVANSIRKGVLFEIPDAEIKVLPLADGGEGTVDSMVSATRGKILNREVTDPLGRKIKSRFGILGDGKTAVIEMAAASGLELLQKEERNPWHTNTYGTGELILQAMEEGYRRIIMGIGGSATNDGGVGMARALGIRFLDRNGEETGFSGGDLMNIDRIDMSSVDPRIHDTSIVVACDVNNPLAGVHGASYVYGLQKGADLKMVKKLDQNLARLGRLIKEQLHIDILNIPGSGAAGGLGGGLVAFTGAELKPGFQIIREISMLDEHVKWADLIITGEGKMDIQTRYGKTPMGVAGVAQLFGKPVIALAGTLGEGYNELYDLGFDAIFSIMEKPVSLKEALITAPQLLQRCARSCIRLYRVGR